MEEGDGLAFAVEAFGEGLGPGFDAPGGVAEAGGCYGDMHGERIEEKGNKVGAGPFILPAP